jgi:hypothetical protein
MDGIRSKKYEDELDQLPNYMKERVAYLIDQKVEAKVRAFMEEFRQEIYQDLAEQRRQNEEHIQYYAQQKLGPLPAGKQFVPTQTIQSRPVPVKSQYSANSLGTVKPTAYSKSPTRQSNTVVAPQYQAVPNQPYQPPPYVKQTPNYAAVP